MFAVYGFGGIPGYLGQKVVSHCFPLNGNLKDPAIKGVHGVLQTYRTTLP
jgi:Copine